jgi:hypothetical protein
MLGAAVKFKEQLTLFSMLIQPLYYILYDYKDNVFRLSKTQTVSRSQNLGFARRARFGCDRSKLCYSILILVNCHGRDTAAAE